MKQALNMAMLALNYDEVPIGAVIKNHTSNEIIAQNHNKVITNIDSTAHAEILVLREAATLLQSVYLDSCDIYVTLEPCAMCAHAISLARVRRLYFGASDIKSGGVEHGAKVFNYSNHKPEVYGGIMSSECSGIITKFFRNKRCVL